jgi:hypothetical protein
MRTTLINIGIALTALAATRSSVHAAVFNEGSLRGRYTGNVTISESIPDGSGGTLQIEARALMALTFDAQGAAIGLVSVSAYVPGAAQTLFTCVFDATGNYQLGDAGLGTATLSITPTSACAGPATLKMSLLVGGRFRNRLDVTIDGADSVPPTDPIPLVGSGTLANS